MASLREIVFSLKKDSMGHSVTFIYKWYFCIKEMKKKVVLYRLWITLYTLFYRGLIHIIRKFATSKKNHEHNLYNLKQDINTKSRICFNNFKWFVSIHIHIYTQIDSKLFLWHIFCYIILGKQNFKFEVSIGL